MELRHLRSFVVLAHRLHFTQAAEELTIAQPALTQQIQALERELGVRLFERSSRSIRLTPAGQGLLVHAERVLTDVAMLINEMHAYAGLRRGRLRIGLLQSLGVSGLAGLLARFHARYEGIELVLHEDVTESMIEQVEEGRLDLAWIHTVGTFFPQDTLPRQIESREIFTEAVHLAAAPPHPLVGRKSLAWNEVQAEKFILFKSGSGLRQIALHLAQQAHFRPQIVFESRDISSIRALVSEGVGVSVFPQSVIDSAERTIVPLDLVPALPPRTVQLVWHRQRTSMPALQAFLDFVHEDLDIHPWMQPHEGRKKASPRSRSQTGA